MKEEVGFCRSSKSWGDIPACGRFSAGLRAQMKKSRPGTLLHVLAHPASLDELLAIIFTESTTIGARTYEVTKRMLQRETQTVETAFGPVRVKVARLGSRVVNVAPEYEDCRELARRHDLPLKEVYTLARAGFGLAGGE